MVVSDGPNDHIVWPAFLCAWTRMAYVSTVLGFFHTSTLPLFLIARWFAALSFPVTVDEFTGIEAGSMMGSPETQFTQIHCDRDVARTMGSPRVRGIMYVGEELMKSIRLRACARLILMSRNYPKE
jgi:hypothetical protein